MAISQLLHQLLVLDHAVRSEFKGYAKTTWVTTGSGLVQLQPLDSKEGDMGEKLGVGWLDVLGDFWWWTEEDGGPKVWNAGDNLLALDIEWTKSTFLDSLWIDAISVICAQLL
jgi:hypothetical protein